MEAPEKIYLTEDNPSKEWYRTKQVGFDSIEYTRTDAFIEKACVKLKKLMYDNLMFQNKLHRKEVTNNFVEDFKKYMEE
jgi:hypothetical protein